MSMSILPVVTPKHLLTTLNVIQNEGLLPLAQQLAAHNKNASQCPISVGTYEKDCEMDLKLSLLVGGSGGRGGERDGEIWVVCMDWEWRTGGIAGEYRGVFVVLGEEAWRGETGSNVFIVRRIRQCLKIMAMSQRQLQSRRKMEQLLIKSNTKYQNTRSLHNIKTLAESLLHTHIQKQLKFLSKAISFYGHQRLKKLRRYFAKWNIWYFQKVIENKEEEIIGGDYLIERSNRKLLGKMFGSWKLLLTQKHALRKQNKF